MLLDTPYQRFNIVRRIVGLLVLFISLGTCLVVILIIATNSLAALRSYSTMQTHWTETRKEATYQIVQFAKTGDFGHQTKFTAAMNTIGNMTQVRNESLKENTDSDVIHRNLVKSYMLPGETADMITTFERFKDFNDFKIAIREWQRSDSLVYIYNDIIADLKAKQRTDGLPATDVTVNRIKAIDNQLTEVQYALAAALTSGTNFLNQVILWVAISLGGLLFIISSVLSLRFLKSVKTWHRRLSVSEQRYKSLFEQNLNAVFSMDETGRIEEGNKMFDRYFKKQFTDEQILTLPALIKDRSTHEVDTLLDRVRHEQSLGFLSVVPGKNGGQQYFYFMLMPIFVDQKMKGIFGVAEDVTFQKRAEAKIKDQLREKSVLLAEIHHRVKNNLAVISGLLELQQGVISNLQARDALEEAKGRIRSMAVIHEQVYQNKNLSDINFYDYIQQLGKNVRQTYTISGKEIKLHVEAKNIALTLDQIIPCGLIINELLCNAYKYAFANRDEGNIWICIKEQKKRVTLVVGDDGIGLRNDWQDHQSETLGLSLVQILTQQLEGELVMGTEYATHFKISFDKEPISNGFRHKDGN